MRGETGMVQDIANLILGTKGVQNGKLVLTTTAITCNRAIMQQPDASPAGGCAPRRIAFAMRGGFLDKSERGGYHAARCNRHARPRQRRNHDEADHRRGVLLGVWKRRSSARRRRGGSSRSCTGRALGFLDRLVRRVAPFFPAAISGACGMRNRQRRGDQRCASALSGAAASFSKKATLWTICDVFARRWPGGSRGGGQDRNPATPRWSIAGTVTASTSTQAASACCAKG